MTYNEVIKDTIPVLKQVISKHQIKFEAPILATKLKENEGLIKDKIEVLLDEVQKDFERANFGLKTKKPTALQKSVLNVSYTHALCELAWFMLSFIDIHKKTYIN